MPLSDPAEVTESGGVDCQQQTLKAMKFPAMDDADALPSSYITRVLTALSQWSCKIQVVVDFFQSVEQTPNLKAILI